MYNQLIDSLTQTILVFARIKGLKPSTERGHLSFAESYLYHTLYRAMTTEQEADAEDDRTEFSSSNFYEMTSEEDLFENEARRLEGMLREATLTAPADFCALPWRWIDPPSLDERHDYDFDSYDEGTRCEVVSGVVSNALKLAEVSESA